MSNRPLVSVLTPSYNQSQWIKDNLNSVRNQTYPHIEHIVMDGGSTDETIEILSSFEGEGNLNWRSEKDRGQSHALNKAFDASSGEILGWINSDDAYVDRRAIERAVEVFQRDPDVGVVYGHGLVLSKSNKFMQFLWSPPFSRRLLKYHTYFIQPSVFFRRSAVPNQFLDEDLHFIMDQDLWLRMMKKTKFQRINVVVAIDRHQPSRKTLQQRFYEEFWRYDLGRGVNPHASLIRVLRSMTLIVRRVASIPHIIRLPFHVDPAIEIDYGSLSKRLSNQLFRRRAQMDQE